MSVKVRGLSKIEAEQRLDEIANLRIIVFREFPYIYDGSIKYEVQYLGRYLRSENAVFFGAFNADDKLVGVSTCLPLAEEMIDIQTPFLLHKIPIQKVFYFGESLLLQKYRGQGLGKSFFDLREKYALSFPEVEITTFCAVERPDHHPLRPQGYRSLKEFWNARGYNKNKDLTCELEWLDIDQAQDTFKKLTFWTKSWSK